MGERYLYDVFVSYSRTADARLFVKGVLVPELKRFLVGALGRSSDVFFDDDAVPAGGKIPRRVADGLRSSRLLVPVLTASYWDSAWCRAELVSFEQREGDRDDLVVPVQLADGARNSESIEQRTRVDLKRFGHLREYCNMARYHECAEEIRGLADQLAKRMAGVPDFDPKFPVATPARIIITPPTLESL